MYDRTIIAYHGCDRAVAERLLEGHRFTPSQNDYDWLGRGIYFWEYGSTGRCNSPATRGSAAR